MRRQLLISTALIALAAVLALGIPLGIVGGRLVDQRLEQQLEREADGIAGQLTRDLRAGARIDAATLNALAAPGHRVEVVLPDGRRPASSATFDGDVVRVAAGDRSGLAVSVIAPAHERTEDVGAVWLAVIVLSFVAVAFAVGLALLQARRLSRPLEALAEQAALLGRGRTRQAPASRIAEVDRVQEALTDGQIRVTEALRREREFSANVSHQLRSPLTGLRMRLEELASDTEPGVASEAGAALAQADRLMETIQGLELLATSGVGLDGPTDLAALIPAHVEETWRARFAASGRAITVEGRGGRRGQLDAEAARQVVDVLLDNALRHGRGAVRVELSDVDGWARLAVEDDGAVDTAHGSRIFERSWSGGAGHGIGLALARELVRQAGGEMCLRSASPTRFEVLVRRHEPAIREPRARVRTRP